MKKLLSVLLAVMMLAAIGIPAFADAGREVELEGMGITITVPESFEEIPGIVEPYPNGNISRNPDAFAMSMLYLGVDNEELERLQNLGEGQLTEEDAMKIMLSQGTIGYVLAVEGDLAEVADQLGIDPAYLSVAVEVGEANGFFFYFIPETDEDFLAGLEPKFADSFAEKQNAILEFLQNAVFTAPEDPDMLYVGQSFQFETTDVFGENVSSEELFAQNKITMVNYWGTWCGPCVNELGELAEINTELQKYGCGVVGILNDGDTEEGVETAKELMEENGTNYPVLIPTDEMSDILDGVSGYPTTFFVDQNGTIVVPPIVGAAVDKYIPMVLNALDQVKDRTATPKTVAAAAMTKGTVKGGTDSYRVFVYDTDGKPVQGATIQFCDDATCNMGKTDADGVAVFEGFPEGVVYTVHVLKVPEGYVADRKTEYQTLDTFSDVYAVIEKA